MNLRLKTKVTLLSLASIFMLSACDSESENETSMTEFTLNFAALSNGETVSCDTNLTGFGENEEYSVGVRDLRFYVSKVTFYDQYGEEVESTFDDSDFQLNHDEGFVGLIDLTDNTTGTCTGANSGTARTNSVLTGTMLDTGVSKVTFDLGVPQAVMKDVIATTSAEDAPSPLNEMYWSWASGYRHFVMNFAIENTSALTGEGLVHIGSRSCGGDLLALEDQDSCDYVNTPQVELTDFDPSINTVVINVDELLSDIAFSSTDAETATETLGVSCHSTNTTLQPDCGPIFTNLGLNIDTGVAAASSNKVVSFN